MFTEESRIKFRETRAKTKERRTHQICKVYEFKIDSSYLNLKEINQVEMMFLEKKWYHNYILSQEKPFEFDYKTVNITKLNKNREIENVKIENLPAQLRIGIITQFQDNIKSLSAKKKNGSKVGRLKFLSECNSIDLISYGIHGTCRIIGKNKFKILGIKRHLRVHGINQITPEMEITNAKLLRKADGYYIHLTTFQLPKEDNTIKKPYVGLDFGIKHNITTSDGDVFDISIGETEHLKRLQQNLARAKENSNNRKKIINLIGVSYQKIDNQKKDKANKIVHFLLSNYEQVYIQDENLRGWQAGWFGKQVQHSAMGRIKAKLRASKQVTMIDRFLPTTKMCPACGSLNSLKLSDRIFTCQCGYSEDRDIKAAKTVMMMGLQSLVSTEHTDFKPVEKETSKFVPSDSSHFCEAGSSS